MTSQQYFPRLLDPIIKDNLEAMGALLIQGPKWCGKTTSAEQHANSVLYFDDPMALNNNLLMAENNIYRLLEGDTPRLIDEWQYAPKLWDAIRFTVDHRPGNGQFILTGSAVPADKTQIHHSGTGRFAWLTMRPMSLWESKDSTGEVSLAALFDGTKQIEGTNKLKLEDIAFLLCRGGWPNTITQAPKNALKTSANYVTAIAESDISRVDSTLRNPHRVRLLMRSLARLQGSQAPNAVIRDNMRSNDKEDLSENTIYSYLNALRKIFVIDDLPAWSTNLRSKSVIRTTDTRYFIDPSIATASLGLTPNDLLNNLNTFGLLFETMAIRDLRAYASSLDARVYHYRDSNGLECDAVVELPNGRYGLIEIKLGGSSAILKGQQTLTQLTSIINTERAGEPAFKMVLTAAGQYAYTLKDNTLVVPIGCLKN